MGGFRWMWLSAASSLIGPIDVKCRKRRHRDYETAIAHLQRARSWRTNGRVEQRAYYCKRCGSWHLTGSPEIGDRVP